MTWKKSTFYYSWLKKKKRWKRNTGPNVHSYVGKKLIERRAFLKTKGFWTKDLNLWFRSFFHDNMHSQSALLNLITFWKTKAYWEKLLEMEMILSYALNRGHFFRSCLRNFCKHIGLHWKQKNLSVLLVLVPSQYFQKCKNRRRQLAKLFRIKKWANVLRTSNERI